MQGMFKGGYRFSRTSRITGGAGEVKCENQNRAQSVDPEQGFNLEFLGVVNRPVCRHDVLNHEPSGGDLHSTQLIKCEVCKKTFTRKHSLQKTQR